MVGFLYSESVVHLEEVVLSLLQVNWIQEVYKNAKSIVSEHNQTFSREGGWVALALHQHFKSNLMELDRCRKEM